MKKGRFLVFSLLFLLVSLSITTTNFALKPGACYYCSGDGTPDNACAGASGSGWSGCATGTLHCGFSGSPCMSE